MREITPTADTAASITISRYHYRLAMMRATWRNIDIGEYIQDKATKDRPWSRRG